MPNMPPINYSPEGLYLSNRLDSLEKKVSSLDLEKKLKIDYMLKMNQLEKNDKTHQALYDKLFKQIAELKERVEGIYKSVHGIAPDEIIQFNEELMALEDSGSGKEKDIQYLIKIILKGDVVIPTEDIEKIHKIKKKYEFNKGSGGEKTVGSERDLHGPGPSLTTDSKLPEPMSKTWLRGGGKPKAEPEKDYVRFVRNYEGYWKSEYDKLIEEFIEDLKGIPLGISVEDEGKYIFWMSPLKKKWQGRLK